MLMILTGGLGMWVCDKYALSSADPRRPTHPKLEIHDTLKIRYVRAQVDSDSTV
jgi:hypothetical protein